MRIGLVEFLLILAIASLTVGPQVALFVDRWMRRANRANARAARRRAEYAAQMAAERDALISFPKINKVMDKPRAIQIINIVALIVLDKPTRT